jgi:hypothetical protein
MGSSGFQRVSYYVAPAQKRKLQGVAILQWFGVMVPEAGMPLSGTSRLWRIEVDALAGAER